VAALCAAPGLSIEVFEARPAPSQEPRILALSHASRTLLEDVDAWPAGEATPIMSIHISQKGGPGRTLLDAAEQGLPALGYTVSYASLEEALARRLGRDGVPIHYGESCEAIRLAPESARLTFTSGREVGARLLVLADGGANAAKIPGIAFTGKDYEQEAVIGQVATDRAHGARAYERFTPQGPVALLPMGERYAFVFTAAPTEAKRLLAADDAQFLAELQSHFGDRAGRFVSVSGRASFPLRLRSVNVPVALRTAIVGNAAQALHPIAGQGLNMGLRDVAALAEAIADAARLGLDIGGADVLERYQRWRRFDTMTMGVATDGLNRLFSNRSDVLRLARDVGLGLVERMPALKRVFIREAAGFTGDVPKLMRGEVL